MQTALQDWRTFSSDAGVGLANLNTDEVFRPRSIILEVDPPLHDQTRPALAMALSPAVIRALKPTFEAEAEAMVEALASRGSFDGVTDLAEVYPLKVFADALGLRPDGRENLLPYAAVVFNDFGPPNHLFEETRRGADAVRDWVIAQCHRDTLQPGGIGARVFEAADRGEVSEEEAHKLVRSLLTAGLDTTVYGLGNALFAFATHPEAWAQLRAEPSLARQAFEEVLRFELSVQTFFRTTTCETELGGVPLPQGTKILLFLGAANRDPRRWEAPERFDLTRRASRARRVRLRHPFLRRPDGGAPGRRGRAGGAGRRAERIELAGEPVRRLNNTLRGLASLPLRVA